MKFDEMVEQSYRDLDEAKRDALKCFTADGSDANALKLWQMMCEAARVVTRWSEGHG